MLRKKSDVRVKYSMVLFVRRMDKSTENEAFLWLVRTRESNRWRNN